MEFIKSALDKLSAHIRQLSKMDKIIWFLTISILVFDVLQLLLANRWWLWEFTTFIPWYAIVIAHIVMIVGLTASQEGWMALILTLALLFQFRIVDVGKGKPVIIDNETTQQVSLFSWNTEFWEPDATEAQLFAHIGANSSDIIHLQEAMELNGDAKPVEKRMQELLGEQYTVVQYGELVSATRLPVLEVTASDVGAFQRMDLLIGGKIVSAYNVHIPVHVTPSLIKDPTVMVTYVRDKFYRRQQASAALIADLRQNPNPKIISGDFNSQTTMPLIHYYMDNFAEAARDVSFGIPTSIKIGGVKLWRIDYVFGDKIDFTQFNEVDPANLSDHWGQQASFVVK
jgi:endonuclease/exonuclease/phosphatase (EEP) superfamily protein YafD